MFIIKLLFYTAAVQILFKTLTKIEIRFYGKDAGEKKTSPNQRPIIKENHIWKNFCKNY